MLKRGGKAYTEIVPNCKSKTLQDIIRGKVSAESVIHADGGRGYDGLVDIGCAMMNLLINKLTLMT